MLGVFWDALRQTDFDILSPLPTHSQLYNLIQWLVAWKMRLKNVGNDDWISPVRIHSFYIHIHQSIKDSYSYDYHVFLFERECVDEIMHQRRWRRRRSQSPLDWGKQPMYSGWNLQECANMKRLEFLEMLDLVKFYPCRFRVMSLHVWWIWQYSLPRALVYCRMKCIDGVGLIV